MNLQHQRCANPRPRSRLYLPQNIQTCCRSLPNSYSARPGGSVPKLKRPERESDHSISPNAKVNNACSHTSTPVICLHSIHRETIYTEKPCRHLPVKTVAKQPRHVDTCIRFLRTFLSPQHLPTYLVTG